MAQNMLHISEKVKSKVFVSLYHQDSSCYFNYRPSSLINVKKEDETSSEKCTAYYQIFSHLMVISR